MITFCFILLAFMPKRIVPKSAQLELVGGGWLGWWMVKVEGCGGDGWWGWCVGDLNKFQCSA